VECQEQQTLVHLGVSYNHIDYQCFITICRVFPHLFCLDASFNHVPDLRNVISALKDLENLKMVYLVGNPCALTPRYRDIMKQNFENMKILDGIPAFNENESPQKKKKKSNQM